MLAVRLGALGIQSAGEVLEHVTEDSHFCGNVRFFLRNDWFIEGMADFVQESGHGVRLR